MKSTKKEGGLYQGPSFGQSESVEKVQENVKGLWEGVFPKKCRPGNGKKKSEGTVIQFQRTIAKGVGVASTQANGGGDGKRIRNTVPAGVAHDPKAAPMGSLLHSSLLTTKKSEL